MFFNNKEIGDLLSKVGNDHDELNEESNHKNIPRLLAAFLGKLDAKTTDQAFRFLRILLEISYRANEQLCKVALSSQ